MSLPSRPVDIRRSDPMPELNKDLLGGTYEYIDDDKVVATFKVGDTFKINDIDMQVHGVGTKFIVLSPVSGSFKKSNDTE
jgi:hypothetical protein